MTTGTTQTMPAWQQHRYGEADTVALEHVAVPSAARGEVLLRLRATGLNSGDIRVMRGEPLLVRLGFGLRRPRRPVRGMDAAGTVVAVGDGVTGLTVGDEVVGELPGGGLARFAVAPAERFVSRPDALDPVLAAALPIAGGTAWQALEKARVSETGADSVRVLVIGASGGVGTFAVQLAARRGAEVWALCGERNRALLESLGAARTFDYRRVQPGAPELGDEAFDAVIDIAGTASLRALRRLVRDGGRVVLVSGEGGRVFGPIGRILRAALLSIVTKRPIVSLAAVPRSEVLAKLVALTAAGELRPVVARTSPFADAREALAEVADGHVTGKIVVRAD